MTSIRHFSLVIIMLIAAFTSSAQSEAQDDVLLKINKLTKVGDYGILELRLNKEDEFKSFDGGKSSMARLAFYTGAENGSIRLQKGYEGTNNVVYHLNNLKKNGWKVITVTSTINDLLIINYLMERVK